MKKTLTILLILCGIHFWRYAALGQNFHDITNILSLGLIGLSFVSMIGFKELRFRAPIFLFLIGILLNIIFAYIHHQQSPIDTLINFFPYFFILFYFYLHEQKIAIRDLETMILVFALIYAVFYLWQELAFPKRLFHGAMYVDRGTIRLRIEGAGFLMLAYFMSLNRYLLNRKIINIIIALFFFFILLKGGFRTLTVAAVLMTGVIFIKLVKYSITNYALIFLAVIMFVGLLQLDSTSKIIDGMIEVSKENTEEGDDYIRNRTLDYFQNHYMADFSYYIVGGGKPGGKSAYGNRMQVLQIEYGFYWVDLGLIGFYFVIGLVTLLGLLWFTIKAIFSKGPVEGLYLKIYFAYLLIVSFTTMEIFRGGMFIVEAIGLYLIDQYRREQKAISETVTSEDGILESARSENE